MSRDDSVKADPTRVVNGQFYTRTPNVVSAHKSGPAGVSNSIKNNAVVYIDNFFYNIFPGLFPFSDEGIYVVFRRSTEYCGPGDGTCVIIINRTAFIIYIYIFIIIKRRRLRSIDYRPPKQNKTRTIEFNK